MRAALPAMYSANDTVPRTIAHAILYTNTLCLALRWLSPNAEHEQEQKTE